MVLSPSLISLWNASIFSVSPNLFSEVVLTVVTFSPVLSKISNFLSELPGEVVLINKYPKLWSNKIFSPSISFLVVKLSLVFSPPIPAKLTSPELGDKGLLTVSRSSVASVLELSDFLPTSQSQHCSPKSG